MNPPSLDWSLPWFRPVASPGLGVQQALGDGCPLPVALSRQVPGTGNDPGRGPVKFVPQSDLPDGVAYETHIFDTGRVPTRDNLHDFFNGLCWLRFPATKRRLNRLQAEAIAEAGVGAVRGRLRDALTLFDENAALLQAPEPLWQALIDRDWTRLFLELRPLWAQARLVLFGHALLEKLVQPYKAITAHVYREAVPLSLGEDLAVWDAWLAQRLEPVGMACKPFTPLPVLGVPGWWSPNEAPGFYADTLVFRPPHQPGAQPPIATA